MENNELTALIIEDSEEDSKYLIENLKYINSSLFIISFESGEEALEYVEQINDTVDIFLVDRKLKGMNGFEFSAKIRAMEQYIQTPIVFITGNEMNQLTAFQEYHCYSYITKPFNKKVLEKNIGSLLQCMQKRATKRNFEKVILIETYDGDKLLREKDIYGFEVVSRYCYLYTRKMKYKMKRQPLSMIIDALGCENIIRCHKSYALNISNVINLKKERRNIWVPIFSEEINFNCEISKTYYGSVFAALEEAISSSNHLSVNDNSK